MSHQRMSRRSILATAATAVAVGLAGCLDDLLRFEAEPLSVNPDSLARTGYTEDEIVEQTHEQSFDIAGRNQAVAVTNWQAQYSKALTLPLGGGTQTATFVGISTPRVSILGRSLNPIGGMSAEELAAEIQSQLDDVGNLRRTGTTEVTILGESTTVTAFAGDAAAGPIGGADLTIYISDPVESRDDYVLAVAAYPSLLSDVEDAHVFTLLESIAHG